MMRRCVTFIYTFAYLCNTLKYMCLGIISWRVDVCEAAAVGSQRTAHNLYYEGSNRLVQSSPCGLVGTVWAEITHGCQLLALNHAAVPPYICHCKCAVPWF
jgi:hypothetical protein